MTSAGSFLKSAPTSEYGGVSEEKGGGLTSIVPAVFKPLESLLSAIGLGKMSNRFLVTTTLGVAAEFFFKPSYAFDSSGNMRPIIYLDKSPGATYTPIGFFPVLAGLILTFFI